jgi:hypothetical protein
MNIWRRAVRRDEARSASEGHALSNNGAQGYVTLQLMSGEEGLLDPVHRAGAGGGLRAADLVGAGGDDPDCVCQLVGCVQQ